MVFCTRCGAENPEGSGYCYKCGEKLRDLSDDQIYTKKELIKEKSDATLLNIVLIIAVFIIVILIVQMIFAYSSMAPIFNNFFG
ncbi:zinc-ribbon domain-containing protein [Methanobacterium petrolearium]|uniref:zinc-ribbon domain-containing protein n=1 Tax=Methanobacterium petrolearium TaxID=710190 RepID=UPI001AE2C06D|nr:zinc-ribbon domain-containing protein [Methanobacterium petrolearium]MBP1946830.1 putative membrane protein YvbJ [Methanobacterium petrolearium]BDZ70440.1 hypothetical protein GCM10025861_09570 [Methanobacterium petrolearium]